MSFRPTSTKASLPVENFYNYPGIPTTRADFPYGYYDGRPPYTSSYYPQYYQSVPQTSFKLENLMPRYWEKNEFIPSEYKGYATLAGTGATVAASSYLGHMIQGYAHST